jgi:hypothetical protein
MLIIVVSYKSLITTIYNILKLCLNVIHSLKYSGRRLMGSLSDPDKLIRLTNDTIMRTPL